MENTDSIGLSGTTDTEAVKNANQELTEGVNPADGASDQWKERKARMLFDFKKRAANRRDKGRRKKSTFSYMLYFGVGAFALNYVIQMFGFGSGTSLDRFGVHDVALSKRARRLPVCHKGAVVITDAAFGVARELAILLAGQGLYVLAGVRSKVEAKSFAYEQVKGLEPFVVDPTDPNEVAKLFYRVKEVNVQLQRSLYGLVVNSADSVLDMDYLDDLRRTRAKEQHMRAQRTTTGGAIPSGSTDLSGGTTDKKHVVNGDDIRAAASLIDIPTLDSGLMSVLKGPMRITQAALAIWKEAEAVFETGLLNKQNKIMMCGTAVDGSTDDCTSTPPSKTTKSFGGADEKLACESGATARLLFLTYDFDGVRGSEGAASGGLSFAGRSKDFLGGMAGLVRARSTKKKSKQQQQQHRRHDGKVSESHLPTDQELLSWKPRELNRLFFPDGCGMLCAVNSAQESYLTQLRTILHAKSSKVGRYMLSQMSIRSLPYRSKSAKKTRFSQADRNLQLPKNFWALDLSEEENAMNKGNQGSKVELSQVEQNRKINSRIKDRFIIDDRFSLEANAAAHALLSNFPKAEYDVHDTKMMK